MTPFIQSIGFDSRFGVNAYHKNLHEDVNGKNCEIIQIPNAWKSTGFEELLSTHIDSTNHQCKKLDECTYDLWSRSGA